MALDEFRGTLIYARTAGPETVQGDIVSVRSMDAEYEKIERRWLIIAILALVGTIVSLCSGIISADSGASIASILFMGAAGGLVLTIVAFVLKSRYGKFNTDNKRYELLGRVLELLGTDMHPEGQVHVSMDLRAADHKAKFQRKGKVGDWKVSYYLDPWLDLRGKLLDGTAFRVKMIEKLQHRSKWKTNARGKTKHKSKTKGASEAIVQLKPKAGRYQKLGEVARDAAGAIQLPPAVDLKSVAVEEQMLTLRATCVGWGCESRGAKTQGLDGAHLLAMMLLSLYQVLNVSKAPKA